MPILDNFENSLDDNLSIKIFSDLVCNQCFPTKLAINQAIKSGKPLFFEGVLKPHQIPSWQEVIDDLNISAKTPSKPDRDWVPKQHGRVDIYDDFKYISILKETTSDKVKKIGDLAETFNDAGITSYTTIVSLTDSDPDTGPHFDESHVFNFQLIGKTIWTFHHPDGVQSFELKPGDFVFIPDGLVHEVKSLTPRVSLSISTKNRERIDFYE